jgi:hypothetical protein
VLQAIEILPEFDHELLESIEQEASRFDMERLSKLSAVEKRIADAQRQIDNLSNAIAAGGELASLLTKLRELEQNVEVYRIDQRNLAQTSSKRPAVPSVSQIREDAVRAIQDLAVSSQEFAAVMRRLVSGVEMFPFMPCDGGHPVLRAQVTMDLRPFLAESLRHGAFGESLCANLIVDCFEPFERYVILDDVIRLKRSGLRLRDIAESIGQTFSLVQKASAIDDIVVRRGLSHPYVALTLPEMLPSRMCRHKHPRYVFRKFGDAA